MLVESRDSSKINRIFPRQWGCSAAVTEPESFFHSYQMILKARRYSDLKDVLRRNMNTIGIRILSFGPFYRGQPGLSGSHVTTPSWSSHGT